MLKYIEDIGIINPEEVTEIRFRAGRRVFEYLGNARVYRPDWVSILLSYIFNKPRWRHARRLGKWQDGCVLIMFRNGNVIEVTAKGDPDTLNDLAHDFKDRINEA